MARVAPAKLFSSTPAVVPGAAPALAKAWVGGYPHLEHALLPSAFLKVESLGIIVQPGETQNGGDSQAQGLGL